MRYVLGCGIAALIGATITATADAAGRPAQLPVEISFALLDNGKDVGCGAPLSDLGSGRAAAKLQDARIYIHAPALVDAAGRRVPVTLEPSDWQYADLALLDFKDARGGNAPCSEKAPAKNVTIVGTVPQGTYVGLEFAVGVPVESEVDGKAVALNHSSTETSPAPLDIAAMSWSWQAGRKFLSIEVNPAGPIAKADGGKARTFMVHLGSTGCTGNPATGEIVACTRPNRFSVRFDTFDIRKDRVTLDVARLFDGSDLAVDKGGAVGCMSGPDDPECPVIFERLGLASTDSKPRAGDAGKQLRPGISPVFSVSEKPTAVTSSGTN
jgi:uncharacterized repeat protein (TIGR04052 family)